jgi:hypothetical protein
LRQERDADLSPPSSAEVENRVELYVYSLRSFMAYDRVKPTYYGIKRNFLFRGSTVIVVLGVSVEDSRSHSDTPHSTGLHRTSDRPEAERSVPDSTHHSKRQTSVCPVVFEPAIPNKRAATGVGVNRTTRRKLFSGFNFSASNIEIFARTLWGLGWRSC